MCCVRIKEWIKESVLRQRWHPLHLTLQPKIVIIERSAPMINSNRWLQAEAHLDWWCYHESSWQCFICKIMCLGNPCVSCEQLWGSICWMLLFGWLATAQTARCRLSVKVYRLCYWGNDNSLSADNGMWHIIVCWKKVQLTIFSFRKIWIFYCSILDFSSILKK